MNEPALLAEHLDGRDEELIARWRDLARRDVDVPRADDLTAAEFRDHAPELIDRVVERLRGGDAEVGAAVEAAGRKHGRLRWRQGYDIHALVVELGHLRTALRRAALEHAAARGLGIEAVGPALGAIDEVIDEATAESVRQFQEDSLAQTRRALSETVERQARAERARAETEAEQAKLRTVLECLPLCVWVVEPDGRIAGANAEALAVGAIEPAEVGRNVLADGGTGRSFLVERPDGSPYPPGRLPAARALAGESVRQEHLVWHTERGRRDLLVNAAPLGIGPPFAAVVVAQDVTESKRMEQALSRASAQLQTLVDRSPVMLWRSDDRGRREYVNQTWLEFRGRDPEAERGDGWLDGVHPEDRAAVEAAWAASLASRSAFEVAYRLERADGRHRWITDRGVPYRDGDGRFLGHLGSALDITPRIELEQELARNKALAEEASDHKTRLLRTLSHDARTPLNAVVLSAELLEMHAQDTSDPEVAECLRTIRHSVRNVLDLLNDLLDLTRIDAGALPPEVTRFELTPAVLECVASVEPQARRKGLSLVVEVEALSGLQIDTDRAKLKQILGNLLSNALRYTERGTIRVRGGLDGERLRIAVQDTGIGIAPEHQGRIFDEFAKFGAANPADGAGTGLGLAICRRLAGLLRGEITLESAPGAGSTFALCLPADAVSAASPQPAPASPPASARADGTAEAGSAPAILVAEDHDASRAALSRLLRRFGYRVLEAENGREAVALARAERPSAVFLDVVMPVMDGLEAMAALRDDPGLAGLPVFALTGDLAPETRARLVAAGFRDWLAKPVDLDHMRRTLASLAPRPDSAA
jgi:PAS domain S-box-containing protein